MKNISKQDISVSNDIKFDGSADEMMRLGFVDETGTENNKMRNEFNLYRARVAQRAQQIKSGSLTL